MCPCVVMYVCVHLCKLEEKWEGRNSTGADSREIKGYEKKKDDSLLSMNE